jgi:CTP:molybdopterin cytidylyltransferase MocA
VKVGAVVLAAGASRRLGSPKQLVAVDGVPLVRQAALAALASSDAVAVVVGAHASRVARALDGLDVFVLWNDAWREGMASSIRAGAAWARARRLGALIVMVADQPRITARHLERLRIAHGRTRGIAASRYAGALGVPAIFPREHFASLLALTGDRGARMLVRSDARAFVDWQGGALDVDTPRQLSRATAPKRPRIRRGASPRSRAAASA